MKGKLLILSAPSGSGKTTIVKHLIKNIPSLKFSVSATSRQPRSGEIDGKDYYFLSEKEFRQKISNGEFLEYEEVYNGIYYGTLKSEVERIRGQGKNIILDVDVKGGLNIKKIYGNEALTIFIKTPSLEELEKRLQSRSTESREKIRMRIAKAKKELNYTNQFDIVVINDELSQALEETKKIVHDFIEEKKISKSESYNDKKIGLYFGSFNPIHIGHLAIANYIVEFTEIDQLWFVISPHNPHKKKASLLNDFDRLEMVRIAIEGDERLDVCDIEFYLPKPSYTVDTLTYLTERNPSCRFKIIMGSDNLNNFHKWKNYETIIDNYGIIVYPRPGFSLKEYKSYPDITITDSPGMDISSSFIRNAISKGKDIRYFLPPAIWKYIDKKGFYR